jgi:hypothetical protein
VSEQVTVSSVGEGKPWKDEITYWDVVFNRNGSDFACSWGKKGEGPVVGESVEGEFFEKNNEWRFRKASKPPSGSGEASTGSAGSSNKGSAGTEYMKPRLPEEVAEMRRSHAQEMAIRSLNAMGAFEGKSPATLHDQIRQWTDFYELDTQEAGQAAIRGQASVPVSRAGGAVSTAAAEPTAPESPPADDLSLDAHRLDEKLNDLGVADGTERLWLTNAWQKLEPGRRSNAFNALTNSGDLGAQNVALKRLREIAGPVSEEFQKLEEPPF